MTYAESSCFFIVRLHSNKLWNARIFMTCNGRRPPSYFVTSIGEIFFIKLAYHFYAQFPRNSQNSNVSIFFILPTESADRQPGPVLACLS